MIITQETRDVLKAVKTLINMQSNGHMERAIKLNEHDLPNMTKEECMRVAWKMAIAWALPRISVE